MIEGVVIKELKIIPDKKGDVRHMLRCDDPLFQKFGEVYFSFVNPGQVKAWKKHLCQTQNLAVPIGSLKFVIYDDREHSSTKGTLQEIIVGENAYQLIHIPPRLWYGFKGISNYPSLITNCSDIPHDPSEVVRADASGNVIPYTWI